MSIGRTGEFQPAKIGTDLVVDTLDDLCAMERILAEEAGYTRGFAARARLLDT